MTDNYLIQPIYIEDFFRCAKYDDDRRTEPVITAASDYGPSYLPNSATVATPEEGPWEIAVMGVGEDECRGSLVIGFHCATAETVRLTRSETSTEDFTISDCGIAGDIESATGFGDHEITLEPRPCGYLLEFFAFGFRPGGYAPSEDGVFTATLEILSIT